MKEAAIQKTIMRKIGSRPDVRIFRNNVGEGFQGKIISERDGLMLLEKPRRIRFGLMVGSGDLIGWQTVTITPDMVGQKIARFTSVETKRLRGGIVKPEQENWKLQVNQSGGYAVIVNNPDEEILP